MRTLHPRAPTLLAATVLISAASFGDAARAQQSVEAFYKGNTINLYVGFSPGGSYDFYARLFAHHMGRHIPGNPLVVVQTMPGAGSLRAANYLYNVAPKDGTGLAVVTQTVMLEELFEDSRRAVQGDRVQLCRPHDRRPGNDDQLARCESAEHPGRPQIRDRRRWHRPDLTDRRLSTPPERLCRHQVQDRFRIYRHIRHHAGDGARRSRRAGKFLEYGHPDETGLGRHQKDQRADPGRARTQQGVAATYRPWSSSATRRRIRPPSPSM